LLAYELYLKNKESTGEVVKKTKPIKKIFVNKNNIKIDNKTREEYGSELTNDQGFIQDWLSMPLNTSNTKLLNLPDKRTGSRSSPPYIKIYGIYENNKSKEKISLSISGKDPLNLNGKKNFVDGDTWYPEACKVLTLKHYIHLSLEKNLIERVMQYFKDRTESFDDYYPCRKDDCNKDHVYNSIELFVSLYNNTIVNKKFLY
jgi:hypothetical protein